MRRRHHLFNTPSAIREIRLDSLSEATLLPRCRKPPNQAACHRSPPRTSGFVQNRYTTACPESAGRTVPRDKSSWVTRLHYFCRRSLLLHVMKFQSAYELHEPKHAETDAALIPSKKRQLAHGSFSTRTSPSLIQSKELDLRPTVRTVKQ
jgi:hypothetical protein